MDERKMTNLSTLPPIVLLPFCFLGGHLIGYGYFRALRETAHLLVNGGERLRAITLTLGRISLLATGFFLDGLLGGFALLAAFAGVLCAKWVMLNRMGDIQT